ncbi:MAG: hypothetical protein QME47_07555 [Candidatus Thermoplasmatota archaeon]|nr:hypothetical protein [Candidatus Thermoplasmatota archaeon]
MPLIISGISHRRVGEAWLFTVKITNYYDITVSAYVGLFAEITETSVTYFNIEYTALAPTSSYIAELVRPVDKEALVCTGTFKVEHDEVIITSIDQCLEVKRGEILPYLVPMAIVGASAVGLVFLTKKKRE